MSVESVDPSAGSLYAPAGAPDSAEGSVLSGPVIGTMATDGNTVRAPDGIGGASTANRAGRAEGRPTSPMTEPTDGRNERYHP